MAGLPSRVAGVYWINWGANTPMDQLPSAYNLIYASFAYGDGSGGGRVIFNPNDGSGVSAAQFKTQMKGAQAKGQRVILSLGGANPVGLKVLSTQNTNDLINSVNALVDEYGFDGIDWDLEQENIYTAANLLTATRAWKTKYGNDFIVAAAPGPAVTPYKVFAQQAGPLLDFIAPQYYDYPDSNRLAGIKSRTAELVNTYKIDPAKIGIGCKTGTDSLNAPATFWRDAVVEMRKIYPSFGGAMCWEATYEKNTGNQFASQVCPVCLVGVQEPPPTPDPDPNPPPTPDPGPVPPTYIVVSGDTLSAIANRYGLKWEDIAAWNNITDPASLSVGQVLRLTKPGVTPPPDPTPPPTPTPEPGDITVNVPTIKQGSTSNKWNKTAQGLLTARGHTTRINGTFGSTMASAVRAFQTANGLTADGIIGPNTWTKLITG